MRKHTLIATVLGAALAVAAHSPPASADTWNESSPNTGMFHALKNPTTGETAVVRFFYRSDGTPNWEICEADMDNSTTEFNSACQQFTNGQSFGGAYQAPTGLGVSSRMSIDWASYTDGQYYAGDDRDFGVLLLATDRARLSIQLSRTVIKAGRPQPFSTLRPWQGMLWHNPDEPGTGMSLDFQDTNVMALFYGYAGQAEWRLATGAMTSDTLATLPFQRCTRITESGAECVTDGGNVSIELVTLAGNPTRYRVTVTFPNGVAKTFQPYRF